MTAARKISQGAKRRYYCRHDIVSVLTGFSDGFCLSKTRARSTARSGIYQSKLIFAWELVTSSVGNSKPQLL
jgi:hypothetical protein